MLEVETLSPTMRLLRRARYRNMQLALCELFLVVDMRRKDGFAISNEELAAVKKIERLRDEDY